MEFMRTLLGFLDVSFGLYFVFVLVVYVPFVSLSPFTNNAQHCFTLLFNKYSMHCYPPSVPRPQPVSTAIVQKK
ncbi:hypothetical protein BDV93DRAFT_24788 [Ceratobasidium sp. AG-I]|nr:hypothetical protein BDV93DRAFT_24788 [Ceratobasidium sp. AG-I]